MRSVARLFVGLLTVVHRFACCLLFYGVHDLHGLFIFFVDIVGCISRISASWCVVRHGEFVIAVICAPLVDDFYITPWIFGLSRVLKMMVRDAVGGILPCEMAIPFSLIVGRRTCSLSTRVVL